MVAMVLTPVGLLLGQVLLDLALTPRPAPLVRD